MAETLSELSRWENYLHDLGRVTVKHGKLVHVFNLYDSDFGNPATPEKCRNAEMVSSTLVLNAAQIAEVLKERAPQKAEVSAYTASTESTRRIECVSDDRKGGRIYHLPDADISVFEDTQGGTRTYFAWNGTAGDISRNYRTEIYATMDEAVDAAIGLRYLSEESDCGKRLPPRSFPG